MYNYFYPFYGVTYFVTLIDESGAVDINMMY